MIVVTRLSGGRFGVNPDLVQRVDSAPDTILTLVDGTKLIVRESLEEIITLVRDHRAGLLARARDIERLGAVQAVPDLHDDDVVPPPVPLRPRGN